ncbi:MAG: thiamine pyrophosphate-binding protein [Afipia sp.]|nr:thiamine pyrophosphate-binding protein [Afipia sp.]
MPSISSSIRKIYFREDHFKGGRSDAFGRVSRQPGVFLAGQAGPGAANMVTGLAQAKLAYSPLVAITGLASSSHLGRDAFQEIDQQALFTPVTKRTISVPRADRIPEFIKEAFRIANSGRRGPVVLQIPRDFFAQTIESAIDAVSDFPVATLGLVNTFEVNRVAELLRKASAPVIIAGAGIKWGNGSEALAKLSQRLKIPVVSSAGHPDVLPTDHEFFFGQVGPRGNAVASKLAREADLIIALGTRLGFNTTFYTNNDLSKDAKIVQVDIDPESIGRYFKVEIGFVSDAGSVASALDAALQNFSRISWTDWAVTAQAEKSALWDERKKQGESTQSPLRAERVFREIREVLPRNALITLDAGTMCLQATDQLRYFEPPSVLSPLDFGLVGFSYAAGLGAKAASPERPVVTLMGDGGFAMTMAEITTAVEHNLPTVSVVLDNGCWGAEKAYQRDFYNGRFIGADIKSLPYDKVAELAGARGYAVDAPGQLSDALSTALKSNEPSVIHVKVDPNAMISFRRDSFKHRSSV